jgi:hypothetical protein
MSTNTTSMLRGTLFISASLLMVSSLYPASAKQCIWNKGAFVLEVDWVSDKGTVRHDELPIAQGVCANDGDNTDYKIRLSTALTDEFYDGVPPQDRYLDVWGTIWNPQTGLAGRP